LISNNKNIIRRGIYTIKKNTLYKNINKKMNTSQENTSSTQNKNNVIKEQISGDNSQQPSNFKIQKEEENEKEHTLDRWTDPRAQKARKNFEERMTQYNILKQKTIQERWKDEKIHSFPGKKPTDAEKRLIDAIVQFCDKKE
jgi:hypothetical protein